MHRLLCAILFLAFGQVLSSSPRPEAILPEGCGAADPVYIRTASETGGIPMFLQRSEAGKSFHLVRETTRNNISTVFWTTGSLDRPTQSIDVPVDSLTQRITFALSFAAEGSNVAIQSPYGTTIAPGSPHSEVTELRCGRIVTVVSPEAGTWRLELTGKGSFWAEALAQSDIHFVGVEFIRKGGRPGHEGFFRIDGQPVAGKPALIRASLSSAGARTVEFYLANERGEMIQKLGMNSINSTQDEFMGAVNAPETPFRVAVTGMDSNGRQYQRFFGHLFHTESVEVVWNRSFEELPAGIVTQAEFTIRNSSFSRAFKLTVTDARRFVVRVEPVELTLGPGQSRTILVDLMVPAGTSAGVGDDVVVVAASTAGPTTSNSSVVHFSVTASSPDPNK